MYTGSQRVKCLHRQLPCGGRTLNRVSGFSPKGKSRYYFHTLFFTQKHLLALNDVLQTVVKIVNYIKIRPLKARLFNSLCSAMDSEHTQLLLHTEVGWLSRGRVLQRFYELKEELLVFFTCEQAEYANFLSDDTCCTKVAFLADIFGKLYVLNRSMQVKQENILISTDKISSFQQKLLLWIKKVENQATWDIFQLTNNLLCRTKSVRPFFEKS
ncbi:protein FAM200A-like [Diabrotica undecimpunctata]|uniref:protein FAM200A-like n=1 Tax=Diabrotica undecimpunctata TaxID=50387 RepID=UPI003B6417A5